MSSKIPVGGAGRGQGSYSGGASPRDNNNKKKAPPKPSMIPRLGNVKAKIDTGLVRSVPKKPATSPKHVRIVENVVETKGQEEQEQVDVSSPIIQTFTFGGQKSSNTLSDGDTVQPQIVKSRSSILKVTSSQPRVEIRSTENVKFLEPENQNRVQFDDIPAAPSMTERFYVYDKEEKDRLDKLRDEVHALEAEVEGLEGPLKIPLMSAICGHLSDLLSAKSSEEVRPESKKIYDKEKKPEVKASPVKVTSPTKSPNPSVDQVGPPQIGYDHLVSNLTLNFTTLNISYHFFCPQNYQNSGLDPFFDFPLEEWLPRSRLVDGDDEGNLNYARSLFKTTSSGTTQSIPKENYASIQDVTAPPILHETVSDPKLGDDPVIQFELQGRPSISEEQPPPMEVESSPSLDIASEKIISPRICEGDGSVETFQTFGDGVSSSSECEVIRVPKSFNDILQEGESRTNQQNFDLMEKEMDVFLEEQALLEGQKEEAEEDQDLVNGNDDDHPENNGVPVEERTEIEKSDVQKMEEVNELEAEDEVGQDLLDKPQPLSIQEQYYYTSEDEEAEGAHEPEVEAGQITDPIILDQLFLRDSPAHLETDLVRSATYINRELVKLRSGVRELQVWSTVTMYLSAMAVIGVLTMENFQDFMNLQFPSDPEPPSSWWGWIFGKGTWINMTEIFSSKK